MRHHDVEGSFDPYTLTVATGHIFGGGPMSDAREAAVRRLANREGLALEKSRVTRPHRNDQGGYRLVDPYSNETVLGARYEYDLDEVEGFLRQRWE